MSFNEFSKGKQTKGKVDYAVYMQREKEKRGVRKKTFQLLELLGQVWSDLIRDQGINNNRG